MTTTKEVGEPLFETRVAKTYDGIQFDPGTRLGRIPALLEPAGPFVLAANTGTSPTYCGPVTQISDLTGGGKHYPLGVPFCYSESQLAKQSARYTHGRFSRVDPENFQQQIIYEGKSKDQLRLSYREFKGDLARPAFTQELIFDLSAGKVVGVKGARIEVDSASNTEITYRVTQPFRSQ